MILVCCKGGLGNQLFQYAAGRALAARHGGPLRLSDAWYRTAEHQTKVRRSFDLLHFRVEAKVAAVADHRRFGLAGHSLAARVMGRIRRTLTGNRRWIRNEIGYDDQFARLGPRTAIEGYFQHPNYFVDVAGVIRAELQLRETPPTVILELARQLAADETVCIQVRRTDYLTQAENAAVRDVCGVGYYRQAWAEVVARVPRARAWIFTDDVAWARANLSALQPVRIVGDELGGPAFLHKFHAMRACRHFISANSTFGWWAAWLGATPGSVVVLPRTWLRRTEVDQLGLRLPGWLTC